MTRTVPLVHPGQILLEEWLEPLGISQYALAKAIGVPARRINEIVHGMRAISTETALLLGAFFGVPADGFVRLQAHYDLEQARERLGESLSTITPFKPADMPASPTVRTRSTPRLARTSAP
jgi:addiction module HigA family antidote